MIMTVSFSQPLALLLLLVVVLVLKLYPTFTTGLPFSIDSWPLIRQVKLLIENPTTIIFDDTLFDGYNNHWPGSIILCTIGVLTSGCSLLDYTRFIAPIVSSLATLTFIVMVRRLTGDSITSYISGFTVSIIPSLLVFTSGVTKETFTHIILYTLLLAVLYRSTVLILLSSIAIVLYHHLTSFIAIILLFEWIVVSMVVKLIKRLNVFQPQLRALIILAIVFTVYYLAVGGIALKIMNPLYTITRLFLYISGFTILTIIAVLRSGTGSSRSVMVTAIIQLLLLVLVFYSTIRSVSAGIPPLSFNVLFYSSILLFSPILFQMFRVVCSSNCTRCLVYSWITATLTLTLYSILGGDPLFTSIPHRLVNFLAMAISIVYGVVLSRVSRKLITLILLFILAFNSAIVVERVITCSDKISYYWRFSVDEFSGLEYLSIVYSGAVIGDTKISYLARYFGLRVVHICSISDSSLGGKPVILYSENLSYGFLTSLTTVGLNSILSKLLNETSRIMMSNNIIVLWAV